MNAATHKARLATVFGALALAATLTSPAIAADGNGASAATWKPPIAKEFSGVATSLAAAQVIATNAKAVWENDNNAVCVQRSSTTTATTGNWTVKLQTECFFN
jgi:hypothetical protein